MPGTTARPEQEKRDRERRGTDNGMSHISPIIWQFLVKWMTNFALFPPEASTIAPQMDALYFFITLVSLIGLTIVILLVTTFSLLYSRERHPVAVQIEGS